MKVPTWHEVRQSDSSLIALHLSKAPNFDQFSDLLVSTLKVLKKYDRLTARVGADEQTFLDELKVVRVRMEQVSLGRQQPAVAGPGTEIQRPLIKSNSSVSPSYSKPKKPLPPPPPPKLLKTQSLPTTSVSQPIPSSELVSLYVLLRRVSKSCHFYFFWITPRNLGEFWQFFASSIAKKLT